MASTQANAFGYNARSEVASAAMRNGTSSYTFDPIGYKGAQSPRLRRRATATLWPMRSIGARSRIRRHSGNCYRTETTLPDEPAPLAYSSNPLNQYTNILWASVVRIPTYDEDGNMLLGPAGPDRATLSMVWDGEIKGAQRPRRRRRATATSWPMCGIGARRRVRRHSGNCYRLVAVTNGNTVVLNDYDYRSRRIRKRVLESGTLTSDHAYLYDGWNLIAEHTHTPTLPNHHTNSFVYGLDLSGSLHGAGTIGGILSANLNGTTVFYAYDGNGNVTDLVDTNGVVAEHYEYSPFGETISHYRNPAFTQSQPFRFSTKRQNDATGLLYYGYRDLDTVGGRWVSRDPIGERGGLLLSGFVANRPAYSMDTDGRRAYPDYPTPPDQADRPYTPCDNVQCMLRVALHDTQNIEIVGGALDEIRKEATSILLGEYVNPKASDCDEYTVKNTSEEHFFEDKLHRCGPSFMAQIIGGAFDETNYKGTNPFLTVAKAFYSCSVKVTMEFSPKVACCCDYKATLSASCTLEDQFDFLPKEGEVWYYNMLADPWARRFNGEMGAARPLVRAAWSDEVSKSGRLCNARPPSPNPVGAR